MGRVASLYRDLALYIMKSASLSWHKCSLTWVIIQYQGDDHLNTQGQGTGNKGSHCQGSLTAHVQWHDEAAGSNQFCQYGSPPSKASLASPSVLAEGNVQVSSQSFHAIRVYSGTIDCT